MLLTWAPQHRAAMLEKGYQIRYAVISAIGITVYAIFQFS